MTTEQHPIDLDQKDSDPRKLIFVRHIINEYPKALRVWHDLGLMERVPSKTPGLEKRRHDAMEHMIAGTGVCEVLGEMLLEGGVIDSNDVKEIGEAFMVHDAGKDLESQMVKAVMQEGSDWKSVTAPTANIQLKGIIPQLQELQEKYAQHFTTDSDLGTRIHVTRDLVVGPIHEKRLIEEGVSPEVVEIEGAAEYSACPEMEDIIRRLNIKNRLNKDRLTGTERKMAIKKLVLHWVDGVMTNSTITPLDERAKAVFQKPANQLLKEAYRRFNKDGESAEEIQIRVGKKVEETLASLVGLKNPSDLLPIVRQKLQAKIEGK